ncbi:uncharacterized protein LOC6582954 [Drosophila mojavensis]|uniref:MADF domain-containing protein n=1 Tax=Drosophila mojavensis TaxID=7230 RepID=B4L0E2_DROMO|nr:uncharacterized protein LOC6582954 [Drosophila mojavensis]EDW19111.2 uncharacterized protein Dmoj_GI13601 [Drosophila mojavensis]
MSTYKSNVKLCRAIANQPILYDESNEHYRKRLPSENCWDLVAAELGEPADKCKRRWRQIRNDYVRWISSDNQRQRNGQKRPGFYLADELQFLKPHLLVGDRERDSPESERSSERDSKSKSKEPAIEEYKGKQKDIDESVEEQPLAKLKQTAKDKELEKEKDKDKEKEKEKEKQEDKEKEKEKVKEKEQAKDKATDKRADKERKSRSEGPATPTSSVDSPVGNSKQEFFIKQNNSNNLSNCLIIGVKPAGSSASDSPLLDSMADDSADETASMGGGRRLRRGANRTKNPAIQKASVEQRLTRLQRRKSMTMAAANSLMSSTSPVKMTPVPRASMPASSTANANAGQPKAANKAPAKQALAGARDDIFPRPRAAAPVNQQVVLARQPGVPLQMPPKLQPPQGVQLIPPRHNYGIGRPPGPARLAANAQAKRLLAGATPPGPRVNFAGQQRPPAPLNDGFKSPATSSAPTSQAQAQAQAQLQQLQPQRVVSSSNTLVISTTNNSSTSSSSCINSMANMASMSNVVSMVGLASIASSSCGSNSNSTPSSSFATQTASITASPIVSTTPPTIALIKRCERGNQTECQDIFSDEHFLEMVRPQMKEMNPRQKMHFKQKIFQALIEIFDDATDFPASGEVQHFNINTPSGFDHVTDDELRLIRELVSMVGAAKHSAGIPMPSSSSSSGTPLVAQRLATPKTPNVAANALKPTLTTPQGDEKKLYRIMKMNNYTKIVPSPSSLTDQRKDSVDSISSSCTIPLASSSSHSNKFAVPGVGVKAVARPLDPLNQLFGQGGKPAAGTGISPKEPILVRQMGRRYSVCGGGGPTNSLGVNGVNASSANIDVAVLKRRIPPVAQPMAAPVQRPRYSPNSQPPANPAANSLLMRRVNANGGQRQPSPLSASVVPQKTPQIASIQGNVFNEFATPTAVRGGSGSGSPSGISPGMPPLKRAMIVANAKNTAQPKPTTTLARTQVSPASGQARSPSQSPGSNVANLLAEPRPVVPNADMAGTIAADDFDMGRLKREPLDPEDTAVDILGL